MPSVLKPSVDKILTGVYQYHCYNKSEAAENLILQIAWGFQILIMLGKPDLYISRIIWEHWLVTSDHPEAEAAKADLEWIKGFSLYSGVVEPLFSTLCFVQALLQ